MILFFILLFPLTSCHMEMKYPPPRRSKFNSFVAESQRDYDMIAPLLMDGSNFPCKKYKPGQTVATLIAGNNFQIEMSGSVFHAGGHCQFSISYDGINFIVLKTVLKNCFVGTGLKFSVPIPIGTPQCNQCIFAWSWVNAIGNREFYMNCADIRIINRSRRQRLSSRLMTVANLPGYPQIPEFPPSTYDGSDLYNNAKIKTIF